MGAIVSVVIFGLAFLGAHFFEWSEALKALPFSMPLCGIMLSLLGHCVGITYNSLEDETEKDSGNLTENILRYCGIFGLVQLLFFLDTTDFKMAIVSSFFTQPLKYAIGSLVAITVKNRAEKKMKQQLLEIRQYYQRKIDALCAMNKRMKETKEQNATVDNLMRLFDFLQYPQMKELYRNTELNKDSKLIIDLQKAAENIQIKTIHTNMTVSEIASEVQRQLLKAQSMRYCYDDEKFKLSDRQAVTRDYKKIIK